MTDNPLDNLTDFEKDVIRESLEKMDPKPIGAVQYIDCEDEGFVVGRLIDRSDEIRTRVAPGGMVGLRADASVMADILMYQFYGGSIAMPAPRWLCGLLGHWPLDDDSFILNTLRCRCHSARGIPARKVADLGHHRWERFLRRVL